MNAPCNSVTGCVTYSVANMCPEPEPNPNPSSLLTYCGCLTSGLWSFASVEIDHHHHSVTREPMMDVKR